MTVWSYPRVFMADIIAEVSHVFRVPQEDIRGPRRFRMIVTPRFACYYLAKQLTALSYPHIGRFIGGRDHSSVMSGIRTAEDRMARDPEYRAYVDAVRIRLLSTRQREAKRAREAMAVERERLRLDAVAEEKAARERAILALEQTPSTPMSEMDELSSAVASFVKSGGSFVEVRA